MYDDEYPTTDPLPEREQKRIDKLMNKLVKAAMAAADKKLMEAIWPKKHKKKK